MGYSGDGNAVRQAELGNWQLVVSRELWHMCIGWESWAADLAANEACEV
jgi:hypothetical protein